jgi:endonuclease YncB( thermonuclease family)
MGLSKTSDLKVVPSSERSPLGWAAILASALSVFLLVYFVSGIVGRQPPPPQATNTALEAAPVPVQHSDGVPVQQSDPAADHLTARVVGITDGDTMTVLSRSGRQIKVRLVEIDAPESNQPYGAKAKEALSNLAFGRDVEVRTAGTDQYGRTLGRVYKSGMDVNAEMVREGQAWAYRDYLTDKSLLATEAEARSAKRGLWAMPADQIVPPWSWRRGERPAQSVANAQRRVPATSVSTSQCAGKRYCRQMNSCAEARFYLNVCHVSSLDGDHDGIPCEVICGH